jgi:hypothetical protein
VALGLFAEAVARLRNRDAVEIGYRTQYRPDDALGDMIGNFSRTLALDLDLSGRRAPGDSIIRAHVLLSIASRYGPVGAEQSPGRRSPPFAFEARADLMPPRHPSRGAPSDLERLSLSQTVFLSGTPGDDSLLTLRFWQMGHAMDLEFDYDASRLDVETISTLHAHMNEDLGRLATALGPNTASEETLIAST